MKYLHEKDKIKAPSSERAERRIPCRILFSFSPIAQETFTVSRPDKHSDLGGKINFLGYGNGCCRGFSPQFPYPRIHRQAVHPTTRKSADETRYSFVSYTFYNKTPCLSIGRNNNHILFSPSSVIIPPSYLCWYSLGDIPKRALKTRDKYLGSEKPDLAAVSFTV